VIPRAALLLAAALAVQACARAREVVVAPSAERPSENWRSLATEDDRGRLRRWREAWTGALAAARPAHAAEIAGEGPLLDPDAALPDARPTPGSHRCRTIKLGARQAGGADYRVLPSLPCRVRARGSRLHFTVLEGPQRPIGILFPDTGRRLVFLGTLQLGDEALAYRYSRDTERDMAGIVERVGENRWRIVLPAPHFESLLDVIELIPSQ
jgi:Domain of unknown function (DUF4893)